MYDLALYCISGHMFLAKTSLSHRITKFFLKTSLTQYKNLVYFTRFYGCMSGINQNRISHQPVAAKCLAYMYSLHMCSISVIDYLDVHTKQNNLKDCKLDQEK